MTDKHQAVSEDSVMIDGLFSHSILLNIFSIMQTRFIASSFLFLLTKFR